MGMEDEAYWHGECWKGQEETERKVYLPYKMSRTHRKGKDDFAFVVLCFYVFLPFVNDGHKYDNRSDKQG